jgi:4-alpha-glucanotransferase
LVPLECRLIFAVLEEENVATDVRKPFRPARSAGVLLHPTCLPGNFGIGDIGPVAFEWIEVLARAGQTWWQILPLNPPGYGDSPYQAFSAFAGNPNLISPELLRRDGLAQEADLHCPQFPVDRVDFQGVQAFKGELLQRAWQRFRAGAASFLQAPFEQFCREQAHWLDDYALFMALKDAHKGVPWHQWPDELILRKPSALAEAKSRLTEGTEMHKLVQFLFTRQWDALKQHAHEKGIRLIGDVPIFVSADSADVWAKPEIFQLDARRRPTVVAGVPPDYFSATGQLWGNPHYLWDNLKQTGYSWWIDRLRGALRQVDLVRLDHFRGFEASWEVEADRKTAEVGRWVKGPGSDLLSALRNALGGLPLIAEDLGLITPEVEKLRDEFALPGMRILQFAFGGKPDNPFLPHNYVHNTVVYTGTHDNDTTVGWHHQASAGEKSFLDQYLPNADHHISWNLVRLAWSSVADYAIAPLQDLLSLGTEARMNYPGKAAGNWGWRVGPGQVTPQVLERLAELTVLYGREKPREK